MEAVKSPVMLYTEQTPNPESLKFVTNKMLFRGTADFREVESAKDWSPLAVELFGRPYVKGVYICNNFVTISKEFNYAWEDIMLKTKEFIKNYLENDGIVVKEGYTEAIAKIDAEKISTQYTRTEGELATKIKADQLAGCKLF
jgi:hypothetical protein